MQNQEWYITLHKNLPVIHNKIPVNIDGFVKDHSKSSA